jgi:hypothetical protein
VYGQCIFARPQVCTGNQGGLMLLVYADAQKDTAALDVLSTLAFGAESDLHQKLAIRDNHAPQT